MPKSISPDSKVGKPLSGAALESTQQKGTAK